MKSAAEIKKEREGNIGLKELRYKRTAQYTEGVSRLMSELLNKITAEQLVNSPLSYHHAKNRIAANY